jgi:hypothetical protein
LAALAFLGQSLLGNWAELSQRPVAFEPAPFALGVALIVLQTVLVAAIWRDLLALFGGRAGLAQSYHLIFIAALGKYLPGRLWALGGIAVLAQRAAIPLRAATLASTATVALVGAGGALVGGLAYLLWRLAVAPSVIVAAVAALAIVPWLAARALPATRVTAAGRANDSPSVPGALSSTRASLGLRALAAANASWLLLALANWAIARAIEPVGLDLAPALLASAALGWAAGLAAVAIPAGIGVREAVQALVLTDVLPPATAAAFALLVRLALILGDLLAAALAWTLRPAPGPVESRAPLPHH